MNALISKTYLLFAAILVAVGLLVVPMAYADDVTDPEVLAVIKQLEAIETLQDIQSKRNEYKVSSIHYDSTTTDSAVITEHENARAAYETYVSEMFSARLAAKQSYEALSDSQKAQIDSELVAKLDDYLPTSLKTETYSVTSRNDEYVFEAVKGGKGFAYEVSNHMVAGNIPQTFILVDTSDGKTKWTPSGRYVYGESNYEVAYCCDIETPLEYSTDYKRVNLEDSGYYGTDAARHVRAILQNSYPYLTIDEMKANLKAGGLDAEFVDSLTRADLIAAVQMAIWIYANGGDNSGYFASIDVPKNSGIYFYPLHDYTSECWDWPPGKRQRTYDARAAYRVNNLAYYLCSLEGVEADDGQIVVSDVEVARADLIGGSNDTYSIGMYVHVNGGDEDDDLKITVTSYSEAEDGTVVLTSRSSQRVTDQVAEMSIHAKYGDTIEVAVEGTQHLSKGVYLYEPEGGREVSQTLVGVAEGETAVRAEETFTFRSDVEMGLRIYKTAVTTGLPISDITFNVYKVVPGEDEILSDAPNDVEIERYATGENLVGSVATDVTGYASLSLDEGTYLVIEEHNALKVKAPVDPFYITIPMVSNGASADDGSGTEVEMSLLEVVSTYPKNEPIEETDKKIVIPNAPENVTGSFTILKHDAADEGTVLSGAQFKVYRSAAKGDEDTELIFCDGMECAVVPVEVDGEQLVLTTGEDGTASSPQLMCGTYYLVETEAPAGYYLLDEAIAITVSSDVITGKEAVYIANQRGSLLPSTGGIGNTGFYIVGGLLVIGAAVLLVTRRRAVIEE